MISNYRKKLLKLCQIVALLCFMPYFSACGLIDVAYLPPAEDTAQEMFEAANDAMRERNYASAIGYYNRLRDAYPFSPYTVDAELSLADAYFLDGDFELAAESYKEFESLHPRHDAAAYVLFQIGNSLMNQFRSVDRATTPLEEACEHFRRLTQTWPESQYVAEAEKNIQICRRRMAEHELYIADVFWHMKKYGPALQRYRFIAEEFADVPEVAMHTQEKSLAAWRLYREEQTSGTREEREGSWKEWFNWL